jgi:protein-L-isoaspartate(D-aspartate) O-methyltransferase
MEKVPRHFFVEEGLQDQAYSDHPLPIGERQTISQPYIVALMTEALALTGTEKVLEIGTGSGYQAAVLAELADRVFPPSGSRGWRPGAEDPLRPSYSNVLIKVGTEPRGGVKRRPSTASTSRRGLQGPKPLVQQLAVGGRPGHSRGDRYSQNLFGWSAFGGSRDVDRRSRRVPDSSI